jgi:hypothetical protein
MSILKHIYTKKQSFITLLLHGSSLAHIVHVVYTHSGVYSEITVDELHLISPPVLARCCKSEHVHRCLPQHLT